MFFGSYYNSNAGVQNYAAKLSWKLSYGHLQVMINGHVIYLVQGFWFQCSTALVAILLLMSVFSKWT